MAAAYRVVKAGVLAAGRESPVHPMNTHTYSQYSLCHHSKQSMFTRHSHDRDVMNMVVAMVVVAVAASAVAAELLDVDEQKKQRQRFHFRTSSTHRLDDLATASANAMTAWHIILNGANFPGLQLL